MAATLQFTFRKQWRELKSGRPGHRFQSRYERARAAENRGSPVRRILVIVFALLCFAIGAVLAVIPGPAIPFFFLGGGLLATESRPMARFMDWCEVLIRRAFRWGKRHWDRLPRAVRVVLIVIGACCSATMAYLSYRFVRG
jgi:hypothetical protein